jgi:hypothetical protein
VIIFQVSIPEETWQKVVEEYTWHGKYPEPDADLLKRMLNEAMRSCVLGKNEIRGFYVAPAFGGAEVSGGRQ